MEADFAANLDESNLELVHIEFAILERQVQDSEGKGDGSLLLSCTVLLNQFVKLSTSDVCFQAEVLERQ